MTKKMTSKLTVAVATLALGLGGWGLGSGAFAHPDEGGKRGERGDRMWDKLDEDGDGKIAIADVGNRAADRLSAADADNDGYVTRDEMKAAHEARRAERQANRFPDADGDGVVTVVEYQNAAQERFRKLDANSDGVLSEDEMKTGQRGHRRGGRD